MVRTVLHSCCGKVIVVVFIRIGTIHHSWDDTRKVWIVVIFPFGFVSRWYIRKRDRKDAVKCIANPPCVIALCVCV